jgi:hypothetical protein
MINFRKKLSNKYEDGSIKDINNTNYIYNVNFNHKRLLTIHKPLH